METGIDGIGTLATGFYIVIQTAFSVLLVYKSKVFQNREAAIAHVLLQFSTYPVEIWDEGMVNSWRGQVVGFPIKRGK